MVRHAVLGAVAGGLLLLAPLQALAADSTHIDNSGSPLGESAAQAAHAAPAVVYAVDNPAQPGDAFPNGPFSGGND